MRRSGLRAAVIVAAASAALGSVPIVARATSYTWAGPFTGSGTGVNPWSNAGSWTAGVVPTSAATTQLVFPNFDANLYTSTNNLAGPFLLNNITVNNFGTGNVTVTSLNSSSGADSIELTGANPSITSNGPTSSTVGTLAGGTGLALTLAPTTGTTTINGGGNGVITLGSTVAQIAGTGGLTVAMTGLGGVSIFSPTGTAANSFTGGVTVNSGYLLVNSATSVGSNTITINGGGFRAGAAITNPVVLNADLVFQSGTGASLGGVVSGAGGVHLFNGVSTTSVAQQGLTLAAANTYAGATTVDSAPVIQLGSANVATLTVPATGTLGNTSALTIGYNGTLAFTGSGNNTRVPDAAPVTLNGARLSVSSLTTGSAFNESFGTVTAVGDDTFTITPQSSGTTTNTLSFGSLNTTAKPTLFFRGTWLGASATATAIGAATFAGGLTAIADPSAATPGVGTDLAVVPFAAGNPTATSQAQTTFVTYNATGGVQLVLPSNAAQVVQAGSTGFAAATAHQNVNFNVASSNAAQLNTSGTQVVNALATSTVQYFNGSGTGTVTVYSGDVVLGSNLTLNNVTLDFGVNTGYVHQGALFFVNGTSQITGSNGLVLAGASSGSTGIANESTQFSNVANPFTGGLTANGVTVQFTSDAQLGAAGGGVTLNGGALAFNLSATNATTNRAITLGPAGGGITALGGDTLTVAGPITGPGGLSLASGAANGGTVALTGTNSYAGQTYLASGTLNVSADANLGGGPVVLAYTTTNLGILQFGSSNTFAHPITILTAGVVDTNGNSPTLAGPLSGAAVASILTKNGDGTLTLTGASPNVSGQFTVNAGSAPGTSVLALAGNGAIPQVTGVTVNAGAEFRLDNTAVNLPDRIGDFARITLAPGGNFHYVGNAAAASTETFGGVTLANAGSGTVTVEPATATLTSAGIVSGPGTLAKAGVGTLTLNGANTFTGGAAVAAGTLRTGTAAALAFGSTYTSTIGSTIVNGGSLDLAGQTITEPVTLNGGALTNSAATAATLTSGVKGTPFTAGGVGYAPTDTVTTTGGTAASAAVLLGLTAGSITITNGGNYINTSSFPIVTITGGGGTGATANITALNEGPNGDVESINITNPGSGYTSAPTITFSTPTNTSSPAVVSGNAAAFTVVGLVQSAAGTGYTTAATPVVNTTTGSGLSLNSPVVSSLTLASTSSVGGVGNLTVSPGIAGPGGLVKVGADAVVLSGAGSYSGGTTVSAGTLTAAVPTALGSAAVALTGGTLNLPVGIGNDVSAASGSSVLSAAPGTITVGNLSVAAGATLRLAGTGPARAVVTPASLTVGGTLDIGTADLDVPGGSLPALTAAAAAGYNGGAFNGPGLTSSAAAADARRLTTVGVVLNDAGNGTPIYSASDPFDGVAPGLDDVLVKYTYFGDANLDGVVDGADYALIDAGFLSNGALTGWYNGDFNYDGTVDASDYTLIDNAFNAQAGRLGGSSVVAAATDEIAAVGTPAAVPEPASISVLVLTAALAARSRRRH